MFSIPLTMPPRKHPPQQDPEKEDDTLVPGKQFKEMMHMLMVIHSLKSHLPDLDV
jgi:hypothetical protein